MTFDEWFEQSDIVKKEKHLTYGWPSPKLEFHFKDDFYIDPHDVKSAWDAREEEINKLKQVIKELIGE